MREPGADHHHRQPGAQGIDEPGNEVMHRRKRLADDRCDINDEPRQAEIGGSDTKQVALLDPLEELELESAAQLVTQRCAPAFARGAAF